MRHNASTPFMAVILAFRKGNKVLLLHRQNTNWMNNHWGVVGGKVEKGESAIKAAMREAKEEVGAEVQLTTKDVNAVLYRTANSKDDLSPWVDVIFEVTDWQGELHNAEPDSHSEAKWFNIDNLPPNITPFTLKYLSMLEQGIKYDENGWQKDL